MAGAIDSSTTMAPRIENRGQRWWWLRLWEWLWEPRIDMKVLLFMALVAWSISLFCFASGLALLGRATDGKNGRPWRATNIKSVFYGMLEPGDKLFTGMQLLSDNGWYWLTPQRDGNLVLYKWSSNDPIACWSSGTSQPRQEHHDMLELMLNGDLVFHSAVQKDTDHWWVRSTGKQETRLVLSNDGDLALVNKDQSIVWYANCRGK